MGSGVRKFLWLLLATTALSQFAAVAEEPVANPAEAGNPTSSQVMTLPDGTKAYVQTLPTSPQAEQSAADQAAPAVDYPPAPYVVRFDHWTEADEKAYGQFIAELGESGCNTVDRCLHNARNPFRGTDPAGIRFESDCADLPYVLRFYFAWKRGLPFSYVSEIEARGPSHDWRYSAAGNRVIARVYPAGQNGYAVLDHIRDAVSSATYRMHPDLEEPLPQDFYSPAISVKSIHPGTTIYDPNGHLAVVWNVERNGRIHYLDAHPDYSVTRGYYDVRFTRTLPGRGAGFKNWRPQTLVGGHKQPDGSFTGGEVVLTPNKAIPDFSVEQYYGNGPRPADEDWADGVFTLNNENVDYYDYVRGQLAGGTLSYDPLREVADMVDSNCDDLQYRVQAVDVAILAGLNKQDQPDRLPANIYGTDGDWETYSTPSRDARLKTAFKELRDSAGRYLWMVEHHDKKVSYKGRNLAADMLAIYDAHASQCRITYTRSNGSKVTFGYEEARRRLFAMSFDPYHCPERRWGATSPAELSTCPDSALKTEWYQAEQSLRNQIDRAYDARMDFDLTELKSPGPGKGVASAPDIDVRAFLVKLAGDRAVPQPSTQPRQPVHRKPWWRL
jgi:hypothetical protein